MVVSADATPRQVERLMKAGARAYLTKPLEVDRFQRMLRQMLEPEPPMTPFRNWTHLRLTVAFRHLLVCNDAEGSRSRCPEKLCNVV